MSAPRIRRLDRDLINKIAAGEVVERPASVIKELVENSIDAESSRVQVILEDGGKKLIRIIDDGAGMPPEDLAVAFESHTTSKLKDTDGLFSIETLGFRGEALASIASVSRCRAVSRPSDAAEGATVEVAAGRVSEPRACGAPEGTLIEVRDLFYNTPARLKFLRATSTELRHIIEMITRLALPHPALAFSVTHNGNMILNLHSCETQRERMAEMFPQQKDLLPVRSESSVLTIQGFISPPGEGASSATQYIFLNGRYIRDRAIQRAITEAYRSRILRGKYPTVILNLLLDASRVDVNVHPTKVEVRFRDSGAVFAQTLTALEKALQGSGPLPGEAPRTPAERREDIKQAVVTFFERSPRPEPPAASARILHTPAPPSPPLQPPTPAPQPLRESPQPSPDPQAAPVPSPVRNVAQFHDSYLVEETPDGLLIIDQHALHERILYDELRQRVRHSSIPRQKMLIPELVELRADEFLRAMEARESLLKMGLEIESFGEHTVAVHAVPHLAVKVHPRELLLEVLANSEEALEGRPGDREEHLMRVIACKAAVKAGDRLSRAQIEALLERRDRIGPEPVCPHGRPTTLRFTRNELEKQFRRK